MKEKRIIRWVSFFAVLLGLLAIFISVRFFIGRKDVLHTQRIRPVRFDLLTPVSVGWSRKFPGRVQAAKRVNLAFRVSGPLIEFPAREGEHINRGDLLARIDPRDFNIALDRIQGGISEAIARLSAMKKGARTEDLRMLESKVTSAASQAREALSQYERFNKLYQAKAISKAEYDRYLTARDMAQASLSATRQELKKARRGARTEDITAMESRIKSLRAQERTALAALNDCDLISPFDGIVSTTFVENYQFVTARQPVVKVEGNDILEIVVDVPESILNFDPSKIVTKAVFPVKPDRSYKLKLTEFATTPDRETQTYRATLVMPSPADFRVLPGMTVEVTGSLASDLKGAFRIPIEAILNRKNGSFIWIVSDDLSVHSVSVDLVSLGDGHVDISGDLKPGERFVTAGVHYLKNGQRVRLLEGEGHEDR